MNRRSSRIEGPLVVGVPTGGEPLVSSLDRFQGRDVLSFIESTASGTGATKLE